MAHTFVIDRDRPDLFEYMRVQLADDPEIRVVYDRRRGDRRRQKSARPADRRRWERRAIAAGTSTTLGFVLVQAPADAESERVPA
jgi:hypothetical protein